jgi:hypothetical protein
VHRSDAYVACRDNFKELKLSLHASGAWRLGFTEKAVQDRPKMLPMGADRAIKKWRPPLDESVVRAFYLIVPPASLYLKPEHRQKWPKSVLFIEPDTHGAEFVIICIVVARTREELRIADGVRAVVLGVIPLDNDRSVQVLVTYEPAEPLAKLIAEGLVRAAQMYRSAFPAESVVVLFGDRADGIPWFTAVPSALVAAASAAAADQASRVDA